MGSGYQAPPCYKNLSKLFLLPNLHLPNSTKNRMAVSKIRQNYHEDCEALINKQINMEFYASYVYLSMSSWFNRDDQALHGFAAHFKNESGAEGVSSKTSPSQPPWSGELRLRPWRLPSNWRRRPEIRATAIFATSSSPSTSASRWRGSRR